jgi:hypothetical protein
MKSFIRIVTVLFGLLSSFLIFAEDFPSPFAPNPSEIFWEKTKTAPYARTIKSSKYGDFNFTEDAEKDFEKYKDFCKKLTYSMEVPAVALVNNKNEIIQIIYPPEDKIILLNINPEQIFNINVGNKGLIEELQQYIFSPDKIDEAIEKIIANAIHHPLGRFCIGRKNDEVFVLAEVSNQTVYIPLDCFGTELNKLANMHSEDLSSQKIKEIILKKTKPFSGDIFVETTEVSLNKDWYVISTANACYWTEYFMNYIDVKSYGIKDKIPIHLHPWKQMEWLLETPEKYLISELEYYLLPSTQDIEFFKSRYSESRIYIILGKDVYSDELTWAVYDDLKDLEQNMEKLSTVKVDREQINNILANIKKKRAIVQKYYAKPNQELFIDPIIDELLMLNKRQIAVMAEIEKYKSKYSWRLLNGDFLIPLLNKELALKGWKIIGGDKYILSYDKEKKEFYYKKDVTYRMDLFLFILFKLCTTEKEALGKALGKKGHIIGILRNMCTQLDYLSAKYGHLEDFAAHLEYLANSIRQTIWNEEKMTLIAKEQAKYGRQYLDLYNLGYYENIDEDTLHHIADSNIGKSVKSANLEEIVKDLSRKDSIKNIEDYILEFEKRFVSNVLKETEKDQ